MFSNTIPMFAFFRKREKNINRFANDVPSTHKCIFHVNNCIYM